MLFSYKEMVEKFGIKYGISEYYKHIGIYEVFGSVGDVEETYKTEEEAKEAFLARIQNRYENTKYRLENKRDAYEKIFSSIFLNALWTITGRKKRALDDLEKDLVLNENDKAKWLLDIEKNKIDRLDESKNYKVEYPELKKGSVIYLSLHRPNQIDRGIYEVEISKVDRHNGRFRFEGNVLKDGMDDVYIRGFSDENGLRNDHTYHRFFLTREEAKFYYNNEINKEVNELLSFKIN